MSDDIQLQRVSLLSFQVVWSAICVFVLRQLESPKLLTNFDPTYFCSTWHLNFLFFFFWSSYVWVRPSTRAIEALRALQVQAASGPRVVVAAVVLEEAVSGRRRCQLHRVARPVT